MKKTIAAFSVLTLAAAMFLQAAAPAPAVLTPDAVVMQVADGLAAGQPIVVWQAMPASYQADVTELVHTFADRMDPDIWNRTFGVMGKVSLVMTEKKDYILDNPMFAQQGDKIQEVQQQWDRIAFFLSTLSKSDLGDIDRLRTANPEAFLAGTGSALMSEFLTMAATRQSDNPWESNFIQSMSNIQATLISINGDFAVVNITGPDNKSKDVNFVKVEGKWVPEEMALEWPDVIEEARSNLASLQPERLSENKDQVLAALMTVDSSLDQMLSAQTYTDFNNALQGLIGAGMMHFMTLQQELENREADASQPSRERRPEN
ncbi:MAG TPA: hypothetical protein VLV83_12280 [Acidobacteriota bacterium]|nr:hypothetical protein [Acidobacteriota bacterium]